MLSHLNCRCCNCKLYTAVGVLLFSHAQPQPPLPPLTAQPSIRKPCCKLTMTLSQSDPAAQQCSKKAQLCVYCASLFTTEPHSDVPHSNMPHRQVPHNDMPLCFSLSYTQGHTAHLSFPVIGAEHITGPASALYTFAYKLESGSISAQLSFCVWMATAFPNRCRGRGRVRGVCLAQGSTR